MNVSINTMDPLAPEGIQLIRAHLDEVASRLPHLERPCSSLDTAVEVADYLPPHGAFLAARLGNDPMACAALRRLDDDTAEIRRLWVAPAYRGRGLGHRMLTVLEQTAARCGYRRVVLDTNEGLTEAMRLFASAGYRPVPAYNRNADATHWFAKPLRDGAEGRSGPDRTSEEPDIEGDS